MNSSHKFGELTYLEIKEKAEKGWPIIIPTGCTEQQGPHLPVNFDTWLSTAVANAAAEHAAKQYGIVGSTHCSHEIGARRRYRRASRPIDDLAEREFQFVNLM